MKIAFYYAQYGDWRDKLVSWITRGPFSHCELVFSDGVCFSSSGRDEGVRFKLIDFKKEHWIFYDLILSESEEAYVKTWCSLKVGKKYDWLGLLRFVFPNIDSDDKRKWFCSEICVRALQKVNLFTNLNHHKTSPNSFYKAVQQHVQAAGLNSTIFPSFN